MAEQTDDGWEARMAARALQRAAEWPLPPARLEPDPQAIAWRRVAAAQVRAGMTLEEAVDWLNLTRSGFACACIGDTWCCMRRWPVAERLQLGAWLVARQLSDLAERLRSVAGQDHSCPGSPAGHENDPDRSGVSGQSDATDGDADV